MRGPKREGPTRNQICNKTEDVLYLLWFTEFQLRLAQTWFLYQRKAEKMAFLSGFSKIYPAFPGGATSFDIREARDLTANTHIFRNIDVRKVFIGL